MSGSFQTWQNVLLQWVNCLGLQEKHVQNITDLGDGRFFAILLKTLLNKPTSDVTTEQANEDVTTFLKSSYPNYVMAAESCEVEDEIEITFITSLLLFHSVVQCKCEKIVTCMYTLNQDVQCYITHFLQSVLEEGIITRNILKSSIYSYKSPSTPRTPNQRNQFTVISPNFGTPKGRTLKEIYESPLAQKTKEISEKRLEIRRLNEDLEIEQKEKYELQEQLRKQQEKTKHLAKQLNEKNEEIKKLREEWLDNDSISQGKFWKEQTHQEKLFKKEMKDLETYTSSIEAELGTTRENNNSLQQRLAKAEQECALWQSKSEEYQSICYKLQSDVEEKELELCRVKEVCSELQNHMQTLRSSSQRCIEEDMSTSFQPLSPVLSPENVAETVVDVQLREMEEDNIKLKEQIKALIKDEDEMAKRICDLECRLEVTNENANYLKASKLELEKKVEVMTSLQHELEESEKRLSDATMELDHLSQERNLLEQQLAGLQELLQCRESELSESKSVADTLSVDLSELQEKFEQTQNVLEIETELVAKLEMEAVEAQLQLNSHSQEIIAIKTNNKEVCQNLESIDKSLGENVRHVKGLLFYDDQNMEGDVIEAAYVTENDEMPDTEEELLSAVCLSVNAKVQKLHNLLTELDAKNLESINTRTNLESTCQELNENIKNLRAEIAELEVKEQSQLIEKSQLEECLKKADENIAVLQVKLTEYSNKIEDLEEILEEKKDVVEELERFKESLSVRNVELENENSSINERLSNVTVELTSVKESKTLIEDLYNKLLVRSEELGKAVSNLNSNIEMLESQLKELLEEREVSTNRIEQMIVELQEVHTKKDNLEQVYTAAMKENEESIAKLSNESEVLKCRINELENKVIMSDNELECLNNTLAEIIKEKEIIKEQYNTDNDEKTEHIKLLNEQVTLLKINVANVENEKKIMGNDLENVKLKLAEIEAAKHHETESHNRTVFETEKFINDLKAGMQFEIDKLCKEKESASTALEITKAKLLEVTANKDELKALFEKQSETYKQELANLTDKLNVLTEQLKIIQQEKIAVDAELCLKNTELLKTLEHNESLRNETKQLDVMTEKQKEELKTSMAKIEELIAKEKQFAEELGTTKSELLKEKQYKESLFEELTKKQECLQSITEESNNLQNKVIAITEERDMLQNTVCKLTYELENVESSKAEILNSYNALKLEADRISATKLELEEKIVDLEKDKCFMDTALKAAQSDFLLQQEQQKEALCAHNREIEERKKEISHLTQRANDLEKEINSLECDKKKLIGHLEATKMEVLELKSSNEGLSNSCAKLKTEKEALENLNLFLEEKIKQLKQDRDFINEELVRVSLSLQSIEESKAMLTVQYHEELQMKEEKIIELLEQAADLQTALDRITEEKETVDRNLISTRLELEEMRISKEELLKTHTKQIQETEENIKSVHKNAVEIKAILLKKVEEVEGERDMEKKLREEVEQLLDQEKGKLESVKSQMDDLVSEKDMISKFCADLKSNIRSLRETIVPIQEMKNEFKEDDDSRQDVKSCSSEYPLIEETEADSLHVLYDCKKKLPSKPWNLDHYDFVNLCANKLTRKSSDHESDWSESTTSQNSSNLEKNAIPLEAKTADIKLTILEAQTSSEEVTTSKFCEVVMKLEGLNTELEAAKGEILGVLKSNDILRSELSRTERRYTDIAQKYNQLAVTNGILKAENEKLLKSIEGLNNLKSLLEESEKDLANEKILKAKIKSEKDALESSFGKAKSDLDILNETNVSLSVTIETIQDKMLALKEQNGELHDKVKEYEMCQLKIKEESSKLLKIRQERESEYEKVSESLQTLRDVISGFQRCLKSINDKFESLVSDVSVNYEELKEIELQKNKLEELLMLLHLECDEISQCVLKFTYDNWKVNECVTEENVSEKCHDGNYQQLDNLQFQISTLVSGIEIATLESSKVDSQCNILLENHNILKTEPSPVLEELNADRTDSIKQIVEKLKSQTELGIEHKDWDPEDSLEVQSWMTKEAVKHGALLSLRIHLDEALKSKEKQVEILQDQNKSLAVELTKERTAKSDLEKSLIDAKKLNEELLKERSNLCAEKSTSELKCSELELEVLKNSEIKQAYEYLLEENNKLQSEIEERKTRLAQMEAHREEKIKAVRQEYENKLERLKAKMRVLYDEEIEKRMKKSRQECEHMQALCRDYKEKVQSCQQEIALQKSQIWALGDKLLLSDKEKKKLQEELFKHQGSFPEGFDTAKNPDRRTRLCARDVKTMSAVDESVEYVQRKKTVHKSVPSGMGLMFDPEDEEGEVFNTTNLADLKAGRCVIPSQPDYKGRISELQYRNSLCPPHLKSSYPAETQFHDPREYREDDLKLGCAVDVENVDTRSTSMLLPSDKQRKKDRGQTSYKKPGPPTPGKNGGRHSLQGNEVLTPRAPLRESNDGACVRKASTPSRLRSLFSNKNRQDENTPVTPRGRRLSNFFRKQVTYATAEAYELNVLVNPDSRGMWRPH